jgi:hypothetical protein
MPDAHHGKVRAAFFASFNHGTTIGTDIRLAQQLFRLILRRRLKGFVLSIRPAP